jgi:hypothetical protein
MNFSGTLCGASTRERHRRGFTEGQLDRPECKSGPPRAVANRKVEQRIVRCHGTDDPPDDGSRTIEQANRAHWRRSARAW